MSAHPFAQAGAALRDWMTAQGLTHSQLAQWAGVSRAAVTMWCSGAARPGPPITLALGWIGAVNAGAWLTDKEREVAATFHERAAEVGVRCPWSGADPKSLVSYIRAQK